MTLSWQLMIVFTAFLNLQEGQKKAVSANHTEEFQRYENFVEVFNTNCINSEIFKSDHNDSMSLQMLQ